MHVVDTCGWIEWLTDSALAEHYAPYLADSANLIVPTLVQYELYKWCLREKDEAAALEVIGLRSVSGARARHPYRAIGGRSFRPAQTRHGRCHRLRYRIGRRRSVINIRHAF